MRPKLKRSVLIVLASWGGPMPERPLASAVSVNSALRPTEADFQEALRDCEAEGYIAGLTDEFSGERSWGLTEKGKFKARELR
jgi:hypothetical protein